MLAPERPRHNAFIEGQLVREAEASLALDRGDVGTFSVDAPEPPDQEVVEEVEYEEVTIEPDLPTEEAPEPVDSARAHYEAMVAAMPKDEPVYVAGRRAPRLKLGEYTLKPGEIVPGAYHWPRRETYERLGRIERR